ncbi:hypothetical protein [Phytohabitans rumicis]|uniref:Uncharacterized protein n=1 Tax=Phytohabitans rumicis TaxID=1076125 RepID=A0A6V8L350_9ACTN|nr:hypothetical protein [Phytohabitans rumicis]GFJ88507.1 hypothetical protein Prum_021490 [Phytohabitans rumicis]
MNALLNSLTEAELAVVRETDRERLAELDEDALVELHTRVRRTRNKYVKLYRRQASTRVAEVGARGKARPKNRRSAQKAEVFEDALARVSRALATAARRSAAELRAERIAAAREQRGTAPRPAARPRSETVAPQRTDLSPMSPALRKRQASTLAKGARRQARRDTR